MLKVICDDCGKECDEHREFGFFERVQVCPECAPKIEAYLKDRDDLHIAISKKWYDGLKSLERKHKCPIPR